jgi:hypothetical protein
MRTIYFIIVIASIFIMMGCKSNVTEPTDPVVSYKLDGVWQAHIFDPNYEFTSTLAHLRTNGTEVKGEINSDCFGLFQATGIPFRITEGVYTGTDLSLTFLMETTGIIGHFNGNIKDNLSVADGKEIVGHIYFEYSGTLTHTYDLHLIKQSINYLPKSVQE